MRNFSIGNCAHHKSVSLVSPLPTRPSPLCQTSRARTCRPDSPAAAVTHRAGLKHKQTHNNTQGDVDHICCVWLERSISKGSNIRSQTHLLFTAVT